MTMPMAANPHDPAKPFFPCQPVDGAFLETAPARYVTRVDLDVDADKLFAILDDERSWPVWAAPGIREVTWTTPRPHGVGTTRTVRMAGGLEVYEEFTVWNPGRELAFHFTGTTQEVWARFAERYVITPQGEGRCRLDWTLAYEPIGTFGKIHFLVKPFMGLALGSYVKNLAKYCRKTKKR